MAGFPKVIIAIYALVIVMATLNAVASWRVDHAERYAMRAARDYQWAVLLRQTRELNAAALAIIQHELQSPCVRREYFYRFGPQVDRSSGQNRKSEIGNLKSFRPSTPLPGIRQQTDHPARARRQSD